ncbi:Twinfilin [Schizosaccharomyces pombe]|uniref:Twinfilin n=1 Tax=Schizosaccharomyces pombe (strain 972 / ATCC 24843) TaxID=284812 RepID=TWF1_SCHPO|nr:putative twinfilin [Schizosaccharomyces pombe]O94399.1 RecName: Full=Twinfilin [Schizosaccharomyces pombe 972h-]CAA22475.1 twinfilin (predicted) [Schizosaccharomyces pombe]|eukprot:NP_588449.1 putative twinfilin [Schizosaccharomyces pombe]
MSASVELKPTEKFSKFLEEYSSVPVRAAIISISNENSFDVKTMVEKSESIESDFKKVRECLLGSEEPAFVLVYDDSKKNLLQLISYVPENANVRRKMLYASSRAAFVRCVTLAKLDESYFASTPEELDYQQIMKSLSKQEDQSPLRQDELERKEYNESMQSSVTHKRPLVTRGVAMSIDDKALKALSDLKSSTENNLVILSIDKEVISLSQEKQNIPPSDVKSFFSSTEPNFAFYSLPKDGSSKILFIYICPMQATVKHRMVYSSSKLGLLDSIKAELGIVIDGKIESNDAADITEKEILHAAGISSPQAETSTTKTGFSRPRPPRRR